MTSRHRFSSDPTFSQAWRLFRELHDAPSLEGAEKLVMWLGRDATHVRALDDALTLWALAGAAITGSRPGDEPIQEQTLQ
ncbi:hypothetical protein SAMN05216303_105367 [Rhodoferax sp. OV413]|uniref:hypothetical protein n=1 Tax=Rhodoferax sp. OV413 TaxID=1855285 RepID=UPI00088D4EBF|nr:hypothetical protein [Rhodoferax sp. OV413]SDP62274.1 hypothetical protein SAMN05216303_105367 [Rhodoferax sp. OV413]